MDWKDLQNVIAKDAPAIGTMLGGPLGGLAGAILGQVLGVPVDPKAVNDAVTSGDPEVVKAKLAAADKQGELELERYKLSLADVQSARDQTVKLATSGTSAGTNIAYGAPLVSFIVVTGFVVLSFLAMKPEYAGIQDKSVILYLLGSWNSMAAAVVAYWIGSSAGSSDKSNQVATLAASAITAVRK